MRPGSGISLLAQGAGVHTACLLQISSRRQCVAQLHGDSVQLLQGRTNAHADYFVASDYGQFETSLDATSLADDRPTARRHDLPKAPGVGLDWHAPIVVPGRAGRCPFRYIPVFRVCRPSQATAACHGIMAGMTGPSDRARSLQKAVRQVLLRDWDPIGVRDEPQAQDEYDSYADHLCGMLSRGEGRLTLVRFLLTAETDAMGLPANPQRAGSVADRLLNLSDEGEPRR